MYQEVAPRQSARGGLCRAKSPRAFSGTLFLPPPHAHTHPDHTVPFASLDTASPAAPVGQTLEPITQPLNPHRHAAPQDAAGYSVCGTSYGLYDTRFYHGQEPHLLPDKFQPPSTSRDFRVCEKSRLSRLCKEGACCSSFWATARIANCSEATAEALAEGCSLRILREP